MSIRAFRRAAFTIVAAGSALALFAGTASAHECYNTQRSAQANSVIAKHSHGWFDIQTWQLLALFVGTPCDVDCAPTPPGVQPLLDAQTSLHLNPETVIGVIFGFAPKSVLGDKAV